VAHKNTFKMQKDEQRSFGRDPRELYKVNQFEGIDFGF